MCDVYRLADFRPVAPPAEPRVGDRVTIVTNGLTGIVTHVSDAYGRREYAVLASGVTYAPIAAAGLRVEG